MTHHAPQAAESATRRGERGAALISVLLISTLLLAAGGSLILSTMMSATNALDATPEMQAYYAAETGLQSALNVLRGNVAASPALPAGQRIDFRRAVALADANNTAGGDTSNFSRLSRWVQYNFPAGVALANRDRVVVGNAATYTPLTGMAYSLRVNDPHDTHIINYSTDGAFAAPAGATVSGDGRTVTVTAGTLTVNIAYTPRAAGTVTAVPPAASNLGTLTVTRTGSGTVNIPDGTRLNININQTAPWAGSSSIFANVTGQLVVSPAGGITLNTLKLTFPNGSAASTDGADFVVTNLTGGDFSLTFPAAATLQANVAAQEPKFLLIRSTGFGPRGARKELEMMVRRHNLDLDPPAALTLAGGNAMTLNLGNSANVSYQGAGGRPAVAVSPNNAGYAQGRVNSVNGTCTTDCQVSPPTVGQLGNGVPTPTFLQSPDNARAFLANVKALAASQGRLFSSQSAVTGGMGTVGSPKITVIDNYNGSAVDLGPGYQGNGVLVVTGNMETRGQTSFDGVILVLGRGNMQRNGGGNGEIGGSIIVACFDPNDPDADTWCNPLFDINGGGTANVEFDPEKVNEALRGTGRGVLGIVEN